MKNDPCPCQSGRKYRQCCWLRRFDGKVAGPALLGDGASTRPHPPPRPDRTPEGKVRVHVRYEFGDGFGTGRVGYAFEQHQKFLLTDGLVVGTDRIQAGMRFYLEDGAVASVTDVKPPKLYRFPPPGKDANGNSLKNVIGTVNYSGHYPVMELVVGSVHMRTTPGHEFYSLDRRGWVPAGTLRVGERVEMEDRAAGPVVRASPPRFEPVELYNIEVEDFHTYFVGKTGQTSVWSHNGLRAGCRIPKPMAADALERGLISVTTKARAGVIRPDRHHVFPQAARDWFQRRGVDIDRYTLQLDKGTHSALHYGGGPGRGGGWWNNTIMQRLHDAEAAAGRQLTNREILMIGKRMRDRYTPGIKTIHYTAP